MPAEDKNFGGALVLDFRKRWRHVKTIYCDGSAVYKLYLPTLPTFAIELFSIVRMVTIVKTAVTASVTRAGGVSRGSTKPTHDKMTTITDGAYTW